MSTRPKGGRNIDVYLKGDPEKKLSPRLNELPFLMNDLLVKEKKTTGELLTYFSREVNGPKPFLKLRIFHFELWLGHDEEK